MSDPTPNMELNTGTQASPSWQSIMGAGQEWRYSDGSHPNVASASWPLMLRPAAPQGVDYLHYYTADATGAVVVGAFAIGNYNMARWNFAAGGTFASAPILTAYPTSSHGSITRGDGTLLGGHSSDTGGTPRSYLKGTAYGTFGQAPAGGPGAAPGVTDGTTGYVTPAPNTWSSGSGAWQSLQGDNDYILCGATPGAGPLQWYFMLRLFSGPNQSLGVQTPVLSLRYTFT